MRRCAPRARPEAHRLRPRVHRQPSHDLDHGSGLDSSVLGQLIALYEHITFVEGAVWGIDSFDQWGVELGKVLAKQILPAIEGSSEALDAQDQSTRALIEYYRTNRTK